MKFDLRSCDSAYKFVLDIMKMSADEYITEYVMNSNNNFEIFWKRNEKKVEKIGLNNLELMAFHVVGALDECKEIKNKGIMNLQDVLRGDTIFSRKLYEIGIVFDIENKILISNGKKFNIDYDNYKESHFLYGIDSKLKSIAHRIYYDYCVNGFLLNDDVLNYGTDIHERPEFLMTLAELLPEVRELEEYWRNHSKSYIVNFYARIDQIQRFNFELDEKRNII